jgi:plasmid stability protein
MSASLTLKSIPEPIYRRVKLAAARNHRSMNSEIIACLEQSLAPHPIDPGASIEAARRLRAKFRGPELGIDDLTIAIARERA